ncbi:MAG TPA: flavin reductase family protein [Pseudonocardiaceae bacterium]|nr:flavin reductase family protein [Pseudonocardiaceae bacterium]
MSSPAGTTANRTARQGEDSARFALRKVASGVTVLTVSADGIAHGATVSAIMPISRDPVVLGVCLRTASALATMAIRTGWFSVNVLAGEQSGLAAVFAQPGRKPGPAQFSGLDWTLDRITSAPLLGGCLAHLACRVAGTHRIGDHDLIIAEVVGGSATHGIPLLTFGGRLHDDTEGELVPLGLPRDQVLASPATTRKGSEPT